MQVRTGEDRKAWFRSERYFHTVDGWFFTTRENTSEGPFGSQKEAENECMLYIRHANHDVMSNSH